MVGIVVVSHSRPLALAAVALAAEMLTGPRPRIEVAAGLGEGSSGEAVLGTDALAIAAAIMAADDGEGVLVLMDLGSAVLSAQLALELVEDHRIRDRVLLCPAPLVEGLVVAVVAAAGGAPRDQVAAEAIAALAGKQDQLAAAGPEPQPWVEPAGQLRVEPEGELRVEPAGALRARPEVEPNANEVRATFTVVNPNGLHARPAARLVQALRGIDAGVELRDLTTGAGPVPAGSLALLATLGAALGHRIEVTATGARAAQAVALVLELARTGFGESAGG